MMNLSSLLMVSIPLFCALFAGMAAAKGGAGLWSVVFAFAGLGLGFGLGSFPISYMDLALLKKQWRPRPLVETAYHIIKLFSVFAIPALAFWLSGLAVRLFFQSKQ